MSVQTRPSHKSDRVSFYVGVVANMLVFEVRALVEVTKRAGRDPYSDENRRRIARRAVENIFSRFLDEELRDSLLARGTGSYETLILDHMLKGDPPADWLDDPVPLLPILDDGDPS